MKGQDIKTDIKNTSDRKHRSRDGKTGLWAWMSGAVIAALLLLSVPLRGYLVPTAAQPGFNAPAPPLTAENVWVQSFIFPDRPVSAVALRPGTYGRRLKGQVIGTIGYLPDVEMQTDSPSVRRFTIDLDAVGNNRWYICRFSTLDLSPGIPAGIRLSGETLPEATEITFWQNTENAFPDGVFMVDDRIVPGDLAFEVLCRVRGLDVIRMIKSRWMTGRTGLWRSTLLPGLLGLLWIAGFAFLTAVLWKGIRA